MCTLQNYLTFDALLRLRSNLIAYPTERFSKLFYVREILPYRPYELCENNNTDIEELFSQL